MSEQEVTSEQPTKWSPYVLAKAKIIEPLLNLDPIPGDLMEAACQQAQALIGVQPGKKVTPQTIHNWLDLFSRYGLDGLVRKRRKSRSMSKLDPLLVQHIQDLLLDRHRYKLAEVQRRAMRYGREQLGITDRKHLPSYEQVRFIDEHLPEGLKVLGREGLKAFRDKCELAVRFEALYSNELWQCDHHQLDIIVVDPETREPVGRPWITVVLDDFSRAVVGFHLSLDTPNSMSIALALRTAMLPKKHPAWVMQGIPDMLYVDNGKDYRSHHLEEVCLHFGIRLNPHEPYLARAKGKVERFFRTLEEMCIAYLEGYVSSNPQHRPIKVKPSLTLAALLSKVIAFLEDYHDRVHGTTGAKPRARWLGTADMRALRLVMVGEQHNLDYLLKSAQRKVRSDGIHLGNKLYIDRERKLQNYIGHHVWVFYDPNHLGEIQVYARAPEGDTFVCTAIMSELLRSETQAIAAKSKKARRLLNQDLKASRQRLKEASPPAPGPTSTTKPGATPTQKQALKQPANERPQESQWLRYRHHLDDAD